MSLININRLREVPIKLLWSVAFLLFISLVILKSISNHYPDGLVYTPFFKQLIILVPAILYYYASYFYLDTPFINTLIFYLYLG